MCWKNPYRTCAWTESQDQHGTSKRASMRENGKRAPDCKGNTDRYTVIEMMPIGHGSRKASVSNQELIGKDPWKIWRNDRRSKEAEERWARSIFWAWQWTGSVLPDTGISRKCWIISALHGKFCDSCNRIRMTAEGFIKPCLCYDTGISIKEAVRNHQPEKVRRLLAQAISEKPEAHCFGKERGNHRKAGNVPDRRIIWESSGESV